MAKSTGFLVMESYTTPHGSLLFLAPTASRSKVNTFWIEAAKLSMLKPIAASATATPVVIATAVFVFFSTNSGVFSLTTLTVFVAALMTTSTVLSIAFPIALFTTPIGPDGSSSPSSPPPFSSSSSS